MERVRLVGAEREAKTIETTYDCGGLRRRRLKRYFSLSFARYFRFCDRNIASVRIFVDMMWAKHEHDENEKVTICFEIWRRGWTWRHRFLNVV